MAEIHHTFFESRSIYKKRSNRIKVDNTVYEQGWHSLHGFYHYLWESQKIHPNNCVRENRKTLSTEIISQEIHNYYSEYVQWLHSMIKFIWKVGFLAVHKSWNCWIAKFFFSMALFVANLMFRSHPLEGHQPLHSIITF